MSVNRRATKRGTRWDVRLRRPDGSSYKRTFRTRREAAFEARELADRSRGTWHDPTRAMVPFKDWAEQWLANSAGKRPRTLAWYRDVIDLHLVPALGDRPLGSITPLDVQQLMNDLGARVAPTTTRGFYATLRAILNGALNADLIGRSPCRGIKLPKGTAKVRRIAQPTDVQRLADAIGDDYRAMALLAAELGLRWGECAGLPPPLGRDRVGRRRCGRPDRTARLGHSTGRLVLDLYAHVATDADRAAADLMGARLFARADDAEAGCAP